MAEPCHWICLDCGYLVPQTTAGYRHPADVEDSPTGPCIGCGRSSWADLRGEAVYEGLAERDDVWREVLAGSSGPVTPRVLWATEAAVIVAGSGVLLARPMVEVWPWLVLWGIALHLGWGLLRAWNRTAPPKGPARWRLSPAPRGRAGAAVRGSVEAVDPSVRLTAPLSGRPCLAYEVAIREDAERDAPDHSWLLLEQQSTDLRIGGRRVEGSVLRLQLPRTPIRVTYDRLGSFLRRRGLCTSGRSLMLCETILEPGAAVDLREYDQGGATLTRST